MQMSKNRSPSNVRNDERTTFDMDDVALMDVGLFVNSEESEYGFTVNTQRSPVRERRKSSGTRICPKEIQPADTLQYPYKGHVHSPFLRGPTSRTIPASVSVGNFASERSCESNHLGESVVDHQPVYRTQQENDALRLALKIARAGLLDSTSHLSAMFTVFDSKYNNRTYCGTTGFLNVDFDSLLNGGFFWLDICAPTQAELNLMETIFGLHPLTSEDVLDDYSREKIEVFDNYLFTVIKTFAATHGQSEEHGVNFNMAVFKTFALSFHTKSAYLVDHIISRLKSLNMPLRPDWILMLAIDNIADELEPITRSAEVEVDAIDEMIFLLGNRDAEDILRRITRIRRKCSRLVRFLKPKRDILIFLTGQGRTYPLNVNKDTYVYFRDILDLVYEMMSKIENSREIINTMHSNYLAQLNVELAETTAKSGNALNSLTVVSTLFLPLNLIAGSFGMNVTVPWQNTGSLVPFFGIVTAMCLLSFASLLWAKKMGLL
eukprot:CFRG6991T1